MKRNAANCCLLVLLLATAGMVRGEGYRTSLGTAPDDFPVVVVAAAEAYFSCSYPGPSVKLWTQSLFSYGA
jgi:hypothetical protein